VATAALGASGVIVRDDLAERTMLGDCGAAALGAAVGVAAVQGATLRFRLAALAGLAGLTAAAERVSFSEVIANNPVLSRIDAAGRRHQGVPK
jgi:UDP-N-acetylmuramyl pentapeptide phosphotransferase/UDP-N-acetylglucosamine-1-phosphate transferase